MLQQRKILSSWKEIANYVGKAVRTVQRYECSLGFPIRRPAGKKQSSVMALVDEVDLWLRSNSHKKATSNPATMPEHEQKILMCWKEIADYVSRGVRTVQRYRSSLDFPVHHASGRSRGGVVAFAEEIDAWLVSTCKAKVSPAPHSPELSSVQQEAKRSREGAMIMRQEVKRQQTEMRSAVQRLDRMQVRLAQQRSLHPQPSSHMKAS